MDLEGFAGMWQSMQFSLREETREDLFCRKFHVLYYGRSCIFGKIKQLFLFHFHAGYGR